VYFIQHSESTSCRQVNSEIPELLFKKMGGLLTAFVSI